MAYLREHRGIKGPHLVIVPKSTMGNWCNEFRRFCPTIKARIAAPPPRLRPARPLLATLPARCTASPAAASKPSALGPKP